MHYDEYSSKTPSWLATHRPSSSSPSLSNNNTTTNNNNGNGDGDGDTWPIQSIWKYNTPTGNALVDPTNPAGMNRTFQHWYDGYGKYGVRAIWMDESEPDHSNYISGGQWNLTAGLDAEVLPAWVLYVFKHCRTNSPHAHAPVRTHNVDTHTHVRVPTHFELRSLACSCTRWCTRGWCVLSSVPLRTCVHVSCRSDAWAKTSRFHLSTS